MFKEFPANLQSLNTRKKLYGIGINDAKYKTKLLHNGKEYRCPYYMRWSSMLRRCYSKVYHKRAALHKECYVCEEWLVFSVFRSWMELQDWQGKELDKDIIVPNNKVYSPETCAFVSTELNNLLTDRRRFRGNLPQGVSQKSPKCYVASVSINGKSEILGRFKTVEQAFEAYREAKSEIVKNAAAKVSCPKVREGLLIHSKLIKEGKFKNA